MSCPTGRLNEIDQGGDVSGAVEAGQYPKLCVKVFPFNSPMLVGCCFPSWLIYGHHNWGGDESGE